MLSWAFQDATQKYPATHVTVQSQPTDDELYSHGSKHVLVGIFWWQVELEDESHHRYIQFFASNLEPNVCWSIFLSLYCPPSGTCQYMIENSDTVFLRLKENPDMWCMKAPSDFRQLLQLLLLDTPARWIGHELLSFSTCSTHSWLTRYFLEHPNHLLSLNEVSNIRKKRQFLELSTQLYSNSCCPPFLMLSHWVLIMFRFTFHNLELAL